MQRPIENKLNSLIGHSGNSDVDLTVNIDIDTKAIAYGVMCSLYAKGELDDSQLEKAIQKLDSLIEKDKKNQKAVIMDNKHTSEFSSRRPRRKWL